MIQLKNATFLKESRHFSRPWLWEKECATLIVMMKLPILDIPGQQPVKEVCFGAENQFKHNGTKSQQV